MGVFLSSTVNSYIGLGLIRQNRMRVTVSHMGTRVQYYSINSFRLSEHVVV